MKTCLVLLVTCGLLLGACASTNIVDRGGRTTGFEWYDPAPFLLVRRSVKSGEIVNATVEILPDFTSRNSVTQTPGLGSSTFKVVTENGVLKEFSQDFKDTAPGAVKTISEGFKSFAAQLLANERAIEKAKDEVADREESDDGGVSRSQILNSLMAIATDLGKVGLTDDPYSQAIQHAQKSLTEFWRCTGRPNQDCASERSTAIDAVRRARYQVYLALLSPQDKKETDRLINVGKTLDGLLPTLQVAKTSCGIGGGYGKVGISYEVYRMCVRNGRVVGLTQVKLDEICRMLQVSGCPSACCVVSKGGCSR